jgi:hypothetical protein
MKAAQAVHAVGCSSSRSANSLSFDYCKSKSAAATQSSSLAVTWLPILLAAAATEGTLLFAGSERFRNKNWQLVLLQTSSPYVLQQGFALCLILRMRWCWLQTSTTTKSAHQRAVGNPQAAMACESSAAMRC